MKNIRLYLIELILFISIIVFNFVYRNSLMLDLSIVLITIVSFMLYGLYKDNSYAKSSVIRIVISCLLSFFVVIYSIGLFTGFNNSIFNFNSNYIVRVLFVEAIVIICEEILRYIIIKKSIDSYIPMIIYAVIISALNIMIEINGLDFTNRELVFIFISVTVLPVISREFLCSYLTYKVSYIPSLIFKSVIVLYGYILPIVPALGNYLYSVFNIVLVYLIYYFSSKSISYAEKSNKYSRKVSTYIVYLPILAFLIFIVILVAGVFRYKLIAIGSNSMKPVYEKGDAIIYEKVDFNNLVLGDVIAFNKNGTIITHRIVSIKGYTIKTKGDNNNGVDYFDVNASEVLGKVEYKIKYIGYPTLWINEFFRRGEIDYEN